MRESRNGTAGAARTVNADNFEHGALTLTPIALLCLTLVTGGAFLIFTNLQVTSTIQAVYGLLQANITATSASAQQISNLLNGSDHINTIALAIGWGVQMALWMIAFPPHIAMLSIHRKYSPHVSRSVDRAADFQTRLRKFMMFVLIGGDVITDFVFVVSGHNILSWTGFNFQAGWFGVVLVGLLYPIAICFVTIYMGKNFFIFLDALFGSIKHIRTT